MSSKRRLNRHRGRLAIANFADHNDIRILSKHAAQTGRESHSLAVAHLRLADAFKVIFDRILDGENVVLFAVELLERGIKRRALARAGWAGDENQAMLDADQLPKKPQRL